MSISQVILNILFISMIIGIFSFIKFGLSYIKLKSNDSLVIQIIDVIQSAVDEVSQTFVQSLKNDKVFTPNLQLEALNKATEIALSNMSDKMKDYITSNSDDINKWIVTQIESYIWKSKSSKISTEVQKLNG